MSEAPADIEKIPSLSLEAIQPDAAAEREQEDTFAKETHEQETQRLRLENEKLNFENEGLKLKNANLNLENQTRQENNAARKDFATKIYCLTIAWLIIVIIVVILSGCSGTYHLHLTEKVLIALITSGSVNVLAFFLNVTKYLYHNDK